MGVLIFLGIISLPWFRDGLPIPPERKVYITQNTPINATEYLVDREMPENLFNDMGFGSYLIWAAYPGNKVFVDPRIELYPQDVWTDYHMISNGIPGWEQRLDKYDVQTLMLSTNFQARLIESLKESNLWSIVYEDNVAVIYVRKG